MKIVKKILIGLVMLFAAAQFIRPTRMNPSVDEQQTIQAGGRIPSEVSAILERSCYDCHSNTTVWPWYRNITPVSWWLVDHVNGARSELCFSEWGTYKPRRIARKLQEMCEQVEQNEMPLASYLLLHPAARLTDDDKRLLCDWAHQERERIIATMPDSMRQRMNPPR